MTKPLLRRLARFCVVGASGVVVNMGVLILLTESLRLPYAVSSLLAIEISILTNFALNNIWTWSDRRAASFLHRLIKYHAVAGLTAMSANWCLLVILTRFVGMDYRVSNLIGIAAGVALNFSLNHIWTFGQDTASTIDTADDGPRPFLNSSGNMVSKRDQSAGTGHRSTLDRPHARFMWLVVAAIGVLTAAKVYFASHAELFSEEAYYWNYLQHPALGYFDHPPMVAWVIAAGTFVLGDTELGVRLGTILLSLGSTLWVFLLARLWFGQTRACWAALLFNLLPIFIGVGVLAFPDGPLIFFWLLTLYAVLKALGIGLANSTAAPRLLTGKGATLFWLLAGLAFGAALLSKYTAVLLGASLGLFLLLSPNHRHWLRRPQPWLAVVVALLVFTPVLVWNARHEWASFLFQSTRTVGQRPHIAKNVTEFWLLQLLVLGPLFIVFAAAIWRAVRRGWLQQEDRWNFAASFCLPLFAVFVLASFKTEVHINWTAPCFLSLIPVAAAMFQGGVENRLRVRALSWRWYGSTVVAFAVGVAALAFSVMLWGVPQSLVSSRSGGWRQLAAQVSAEQSEVARTSGQKPFVVGADRYNLSAELGFYSRAPENQINNFALGKHGLGFRYWTDLYSFEGRPAVTVAAKLDEFTLSELSEHFDRIDAAKRVVVPTLGARTRTLWLIDCYGYHAKPKLPVHAANIGARTPETALGARQSISSSNR